jgi:hypothetical protein
MSPIHFTGGDLRYLLTPAFEAQLARLVKSDVRGISWLAADTIKRGDVAALFYDMAEAGARYGWMDFPYLNERDVVSTELWSTWWLRSNETNVRQRLMGLTPRYPSIELEESLLAALDIREFRGRAARLLGEYGSVRALPRLRQLLSEDMTNTEQSILFDKAEIAHAVGDLRDDESIGLLKEIAVTHPKSWPGIKCIENIGVIGTKQAENALMQLLDDGVDERIVLSALIACE